jgi:cell division protein FtsN
VLGVTFALGVAAGRRWPTGLPLPGLGGPPAAAVRAEREGPRRPEGRGFDRERPRLVTDTPPVLTYYHDLTAPLGPPPAPPAPPLAPRAVTRPQPAPAEPAPAPKEKTFVASPATAGARFTVQVGAFTVRAQADALRARLTNGAYVIETDTGGVTHYRVRVGDFATRDAADQAALRLRADRRVATYVTTR